LPLTGPFLGVDMQHVKVEWEDAVLLTTEAWNMGEDDYPYNPYICITTGILLYDGVEGIILTDSISNDQTGHVQQIPRGMIRNITYYD
jgi:hypothetical protein